MKSMVKTLLASAAGLVVTVSSANAIVITESFDLATGTGTYDVTVEASDPGQLVAFGVSNFDTNARIGSIFDDFGCENSYCYEAFSLTASQWSTEIFEQFDFGNGDLTYEEQFGVFADLVDPGDNVINFYQTVDGALSPGESATDFFLFSGLQLASQGLAFFDDGTTVTNIPTTAVPVPAAAWFMMSALGSLLVVKKRKS